ncbi:hypothetical protein FOA52_004073 [Chlamydomonas sp. UWO 241]|nr:hypothetical protein FOA52_004073 [Chlamydomonas sp. UWO 241]
MYFSHLVSGLRKRTLQPLTQQTTRVGFILSHKRGAHGSTDLLGYLVIMRAMDWALVALVALLSNAGTAEADSFPHARCDSGVKANRLRMSLIGTGDSYIKFKVSTHGGPIPGPSCGDSDVGKLLLKVTPNNYTQIHPCVRVAVVQLGFRPPIKRSVNPRGDNMLHISNLAIQQADILANENSLQIWLELRGNCSYFDLFGNVTMPSYSIFSSDGHCCATVDPSDPVVCIPDVGCPLLTPTKNCSDAVKFNPVTKKPFLPPLLSLLPPLLAATCPSVCAGIAACTSPDGAEVVFKCDSVACTSSNTSLIAASCGSLGSCGDAFLADVFALEAAVQCSCCVEALCGCLPTATTVAALSVIQDADPTGYHSPLQCKGNFTSTAPKGFGLFSGKNVVVFLTDQERATMNYPEGWEKTNLPGLTRLKANGITFNKSITNTCMCSAARATLLTGLFPAQHGVRYVLEYNMPEDFFPQVETPTLGKIPSLASAIIEAGYDPVYKGKIHLAKPLDPNMTWSQEDAIVYGWNRWNFPDKGANQELCEGGGNTGPDAWPNATCGNADARYMFDAGPEGEGLEGALAYLDWVAVNGSGKPFFLIVSLINPHDVLFYPTAYNESGYNASLLNGTIGLPATVNDTLLGKPTAQLDFTVIVGVGSPLRNDTLRTNYANFYGSLVKKMDSYLVQVLEKLDHLNLTNNTVVIRTADHGEMGMSHGGQRQKMFNMYRESITVPLVFSNPELWPTPVVSQALVSHVDFAPTMATLLAVQPSSTQGGYAGVDTAGILSGETEKVQDSLIFTYDDFQWGQPNGPRVREPNHIVALVEDRYKIAKYYTMASVMDSLRISGLNEETPFFGPFLDINFTEASKQPTSSVVQWEFYDTETDPTEAIDLAFPGNFRSPEDDVHFERMKLAIALAEATRLRSLLFTYPVNMTGQVCRQEGNLKAPTRLSGSYYGVPTGNGTVYIELGALDRPVALVLMSPIGRIDARLNFTSAATLPSGLTQVTASATFTGGTGVFGSFGPPISGNGTLVFTAPPRGPLDFVCPFGDGALPLEYCWSAPGVCAGTFELTASATY